MPTRRDDPDAPVKQSFLSRALSSGRGVSKESRRKSVMGLKAFKRSDDEAETDLGLAARRLSGVAPLPPSLASTTNSSLSPSAASLPLSDSTRRPSIPRTTSSHSVSASSMASTASSAFSTTPKKDRQTRRISLYDPGNPIFPAPPRSPARSREASVASTASSTRRKSIHTSASASSLQPVSNAFPSASSSSSRPASVHFSSPNRQPTPHGASSSPPPPVPNVRAPSSATAATYIDYTASLSSSTSSGSVAPSRRLSRVHAGEDPFAISPVSMRGGTGTAQMDELVAGINGSRRRSAGGSSGRRTRESSAQSGYANTNASEKGKERQHRREELSALGDWSAVHEAILPAASASSSLESGGGKDARSRETSATFSDASFASMHATPSPAQLMEIAIDEDDLTGAPSMERQETLKALERPWMAAFAASGATAGGGGLGGKRASMVALPPGVDGRRVKSLDEVVEQYKGRRKSFGAAVAGRSEQRAGGAGGDGSGDPPPMPPVPQIVMPEGENPPASPASSAPAPTGPLPYVPFPGSSLPPSLILPPASGANGEAPAPMRIKTIEEIIAEHAGPSYLAKRKLPGPAPPPATSSAPPEEEKRPARERDGSVQSGLSSMETNSSADSLGKEIRLASRAEDRDGQSMPNGNGMGRSMHEEGDEEDKADTPKGLQNSGTLPPTIPTSPSLGRIDGTVISSAVNTLVSDDFASRSSPARSSTPSTPRVQSPLPADLTSPSSASPSSSSQSHERDLALLLKSPRLTCLVTLENPPNAGLTVSLADVGSSTGHPVLVFLGLGSVRYLVALYDEVAASYGLRLICVDRWGIGRTGTVPDSQRGFVEWSSVVEELVSPSCLDLERFSILAHSAGAPYALASAVRPSPRPRIHGSIHLLAPWISTSNDSGTDSLAGPYRFLKYVPSGVLKTAQAAESRVQGWRLGKPPTVGPAKGVGYDAKAGRLFAPDLDEAGWEEERERWAAEAPQEGISTPFAAPADGNKVSELYGPEAGIVVAGPANGGGSGKGKGWKLLGGGSSILSKRSSIYSSDASPAAASRTLAPNGLPVPLRRSSVISIRSGSPSPTTPTRSESLTSFSGAMNGGRRSASPYSPTSSGDGHLSPTASTLPTSASYAPLSPRQRINSGSLSPVHSRSPSPALLPHPSVASSIPPHILIDGLLRASHAESLRGGGTADLLVLLDSSKRGLGFEYRDLDSPLKIWYGDKDDRISEGSVRWLEREVREKGRDGGIEVKVVEGADHGLMANGRVMLEVLESIAAEWNRPPFAGRSSSSKTAMASTT
ncbi:hypothetical protein JCM11251_007808 [Rhodosporidiobolus azoricus]